MKSSRDRMLEMSLICCLMIGQLPANSQAAASCNSVFRGPDFLAITPVGRPSEQLELISSNVGRSQPGAIYRDRDGRKWYLKRDTGHAELQTSAEVISSWIYRHFGYNAPESYIVNITGQRYSASRLIDGLTPLNFGSGIPNTRKYRALRVVAAFLKDWDRMISGNNAQLPNGEILHLDFGGSLGSRAKGEFKPGNVFSEALGSFGPLDKHLAYSLSSTQVNTRGEFFGDHPLKELYDGFSIDRLSSDHPWRKLTAADLSEVIESFRTLDTLAVEKIVDRAEFASQRDRAAMVNALLVRRDVFLEYLQDYLGGDALSQKSYWARTTSILPLTFGVNSNRSPRVSADVRRFVEGLNTSEDQVILFRGQDSLTGNLLAPAYRERTSSANGQPPSDKQSRTSEMREILKSAHLDLNRARDEHRKYRKISGVGDADLVWWDRATAQDLLAEYHSTSNGLPEFVSTTRNLATASRWIAEGRFQTLYRYVYILKVPKQELLPITQSFTGRTQKTNQEAEYVVPIDATPFIEGIYDTVENRFLRTETEASIENE